MFDIDIYLYEIAAYVSILYVAIPCIICFSLKKKKNERLISYRTDFVVFFLTLILPHRKSDKYF